MTYKEKVVLGDCTLYLGDCMDYMATLPDKAFDLAIVDPPYGIGESQKKRENSPQRWNSPIKKIHNPKDWDKKAPEPEYFELLRRVSLHQIIWGANHFIDSFPFSANSPCWIVWDKKNGDTDFSDCELAWASFPSAVRKFDWLWNGFQKQKPEARIHPTQKPIALYEWLLTNYAKPGQKIFDTHLGSGSSSIACSNLGYEMVGIELDKDYYRAACERIDQAQRQQRMF